jgi:hypothetical protein
MLHAVTTVVIQSHRASGDRPAWIDRCLDSVGAWAEARGFERRFEDDRFFDRLPPPLRAKTRDRPMVAADLSRLLWAREVLAEGAARVVWLDADVLVFDPARLHLGALEAGCLFGAEVWIQRAGRRWRAYDKVHNALLAFEPGNPVLDYYLHVAHSMVHRARPPVPPHLVGPRLLGALHNLAPFPLCTAVGSLGPPVLRDLLDGGGGALDLFRARSPRLAAANLCAALADEGYDDARLTTGEMDAVCALLCDHQLQPGADVTSSADDQEGEA